ncbi:MAG: HAMP domain-containing histidine kinase, partial [Lachnospiraceae bacterium]|nr:HAMP domain-containing histidine kinase [Lachnospiraceae bacterium]
LLRKDRRLAVERIAGLLGKICLELKLLLFLVVLTGLVCAGGAFGENVLAQFGWWLRNGFAYYIWSGDILYEVAKFTLVGKYLAAFFWLFYLTALDIQKNRKKQKKPLLDLLKDKDLKYPIQKRLVKRDRRTLIAELVVIVLLAVSICVLYLTVGEYMNTLTGGYAYEMVEVYGGRYIGNVFLVLTEVTFCALFVFTVITFCSLKKNHRLAVDIGTLTDQILAVREGNMTKELILPEDTDLKEAADNLNGIQKGMETALAERMKSERMKVDLVTNVSHDIKTPLTSIISYVELLRQEEDLPVYVKEYIQILGEKSERLRSIVQDVFEVSKATSGQLPIQMEILDMGKLLRQTLADMNGQIEESTLTMKTAIPQEPFSVRADGQRLYRVFQNLLQNALHYSLPGSRIYLTLEREAGEVVVRIKNTSSMELTDGKDFTERFVRGDESRTDGGSGLGLSIAKSFTEACGGSLLVETNADLFTVTVRFPESGQESI